MRRLQGTPGLVTGLLVSIVGVAAALLLSTCGGGESGSLAVALPSTSEPGPPRAAQQVAIDVAQGTVARYRVRETLARVGFPTDAVGETADVSGTIVFFGADGSVQPEHSKVIVDLSTLRSDRGRRDNFLRRNIFESDRFPTAEFVVRSTEGLSWPLQTSGEASFSLLGDITVHGVTRPAKWEVSAQFDGDSVQGLARTSFTFDTFDMKIPRFAFILSVQDDIRLEVDFVAAINTSS